MLYCLAKEVKLMIRKPEEMEIETRDQMRGGKGRVTIQHLIEKEDFTATTRLCARLTLPPGAGIGIHRHDAEDEIFLIIKGAGILDDGHSRTRVTEGDAVLTGNGESHSLENDGTENLEVLAVIITY